ncbi:hypothetical protein NP233_g10064 [Leucocoprinus birnbaumii]|uniref:DUF6533 domain-containing protein n=1 Tax=Leucocoprinus birnbaumii TaxID=56174 RepID=A0AAD5VJH9_9AGAR|nr:hypothetical protein NP233_g10064 [Leucocoprinus birnbaumii]
MSDQYTREYVASALNVLYLQHYCQLIALIITFYDHALTFDKEVELIWKKRWSKSRVFYLLCRYVGNILITWETFGVWSVRSVAYLAVVCTLITQLIMRFRIQALYNNNQSLSRVLFGVMIGEIITLTTIGLVSMQKMEVTSEPLPGIYQCTQVKFPSWSWLFWLPILFFDSLLFGLAIGIVIQSWRQLRREKLSKLSLGSSLMAILLRDNFGYFFFAFGIYLLTTIIWTTAETRYFSIPAGFSFSITTVLGSRLILNLCDAYYSPLNESSRGTSEWDTRLNWEINLAAAENASIKFASSPEGCGHRGVRNVEVNVTFEISHSTMSKADVEEGMELSTFSQTLAKEDLEDIHSGHRQETRSSDLHIEFLRNA